MSGIYNVMCDLFFKPLSKPLPEAERGFEFCSPSLLGKGLGVRFEKKLHTALYNQFQLADLVNRQELTQQAVELLLLTYKYSSKELPRIVAETLIQLPGAED